jgi:hypothetical protein
VGSAVGSAVGSTDGVAGWLGDGACDGEVGAPTAVPQAAKTIARIERAMMDRKEKVIAGCSRVGGTLVGRVSGSILRGEGFGAIGHVSHVVVRQ